MGGAERWWWGGGGGWGVSHAIFLMLTGSVQYRAGLYWVGSGFCCHFPEHKGPFSAANHNQMCTDLLKEF